ncbi:MAG: HU family DNA-binding protein [Desulfobacterales bacterium]|nr:HU family DNA-binding protein [Desulfobacterales bacterium]
MNKLELIETLRKEAKISKNEAAAVVKLFFEKMTDALATGNVIINFRRSWRLHREGPARPWLFRTRRLWALRETLRGGFQRVPRWCRRNSSASAPRNSRTGPVPG